MQTLNQKSKNNKNKKKKQKKQIEKSKLFLLGSLLVVIGISVLMANHIKTLKLDVLNDKLIRLMDAPVPERVAVPDLEDLDGDTYEPPREVDFSRFLAVLEIPRINLRRGFFNIDSPLNNVDRNVTKIPGSSMPNVERGNLILAAHSGDAHISFFRFLHRLNIGDRAYIVYNGQRYVYVIVDIYDVPKTGTVAINRNHQKTVLTLITCTEGSDYYQTVYILELTEVRPA